MAKKFVQTQKLSKKERRALFSKERVTWAFSPASRVKESRKVYKRSRAKSVDPEI